MQLKRAIMEEDQTLINELRAVAFDPGISNLGAVLVRYWGEKVKKDANGQFVTVPQFEVLRKELWDLKRSMSYEQHHEKTNIVRNKFDQKNGNMPIDNLIHLGDRLSLMLASKEWINESYRSLLFENGEKDVLPAIVTEVQCGFVKNHELDCTVVGHLLPWIIKSMDRSRGIEDREILARQKKYSLKRGKGDDYDDRKEDSEEIARKLFAECGMTREIIFLNALKAARKRDIPNGTTSQIKANDVTDAVLLALSDLRIRHAELLKKLNIKANVEVIEEEPVVLPRNEFDDREDDSDQDALFPKKVRKKRAPSIKKRAEAVNAGFEEQDKKKRKRVTLPKDDKQEKKKKRVSKKKDKIDDDDEDTVEVEIDEDDPIIITKSTTAPRKKEDVAKKYKQLTIV